MTALNRTLAGSPHLSFSSNIASSLYETTSGSGSSASGVPGPGALTGKAIKALGRVTIRGIDHFVIARQLSIIAHHFPLADKKAVFMKDVGDVYAQVLEFSRDGLYRPEIHRKALGLLLRQIGLNETQFLVRALCRWDGLELRLFLSEVLLQLAPLWNPTLGRILPSSLDAYSGSFSSNPVSFYPFLLFTSRLVRTRSSICSAVLDAGILDVLVPLRTMHNLNEMNIYQELESDSEYYARRRILAASNALLLDIIAYPEHRSLVLNHPICSTWLAPVIPDAPIPSFSSREGILFLTYERDIPEDDSSLYLSLDLPALARVKCISQVETKAFLDSLVFTVGYDQALRVFLLRKPYDDKVTLLSRLIQHMLENNSSAQSGLPTVTPPNALRQRYRLLFFLRLIAAVAWGPSNRAALLDAGVIAFLVQIVRTEVPESYTAIIRTTDFEDLDHSIPAIIREQGLAHLLGGPLAKTSRLVGLILNAFVALFPEGRALG